MEFKNTRVYGLNESIVKSSYPMIVGDVPDLAEEVQIIESVESNPLIDFEELLNNLPKTRNKSKIESYVVNKVGTDGSLKYRTLRSITEALLHVSRAINLGSAKAGSGHDSYLKGVIVQFDMKYTQYVTKQTQRYHWFEYISSTSMMHKLTSTPNVLEQSNKFVLPEIAEIVDNLIQIYNSGATKYPLELSDREVSSREDLFMYITSNVPMGFQLVVAVSTNYMQLKNMYNQRKSHKLDDWSSFVRFCKSLPRFNQLTNTK